MNKAFLESADKTYQEHQQAFAILRAQRGENFSNAVDALFIMTLHEQMLLRFVEPESFDFDVASTIKSVIVHEWLANILATASVLAQKAFGLTDAEILEAVDVAEGMVSKVTADAEAASAILKAQASTH